MTRAKILKHLNFIKSDLPFARDDANHFLPWIIGFMVFLTTLMVAGGISLNDAIMKGKAAYSGSITVQVPYQPEGMEQKVYQVADALRRTEGIHDVRLMDTGNVKAMVSPWLGQGEVLDMLPLPALIDARTASDEAKRPDMEELQTSLSQIVPGIQVDDNKQWIEKFSSFTRTIQLVAFVLAALLIFTTACIIVLTSKTTLKLHFRTVELLHSMGARDEYIAKQFQQNAVLLTFRGAVTGTFLAIFLFMLLGFAGRELHSPLLPSLSVGFAHIAMFLLMPVITSAVGLLAARGATLSFLKTLP